MEFEEKVKQLLEAHYKEAEVEVDFAYGAVKLNGYVISPDFEGKEILERQKEIYGYLKREIGAEAKRISIIFTYTPREFALMNAA